jgi:hypothetical protein
MNNNDNNNKKGKINFVYICIYVNKTIWYIQISFQKYIYINKIFLTSKNKIYKIIKT